MKNMDQATALVPFGKYKGQPVEIMQMDTAYCDWLSKQSWFREQYGNVYNQVIINNFTEPTETPEHNRLQMRFLDEAFIERFVSRKLYPAHLDQNIKAKEQYKFDGEIDPKISVTGIEFEHRGWDVCLKYNYSSVYHTWKLDGDGSVCFEIKPCLGDDFPAVLRQMKNNANRHRGNFSVCIIDEFTAVGATYEQVQQMFRMSKFSLLRFSDFEE